MAYLIDIVIVGGLMAIAFVAISISGLFFFGLGFALIVPVLSPLSPLPTTLLIGGPYSATWEIRFMAIEVQGGVGGVRFSASYNFNNFILWFSRNDRLDHFNRWFSRSRRCLHDYFWGTVFINKRT